MRCSGPVKKSPDRALAGVRSGWNPGLGRGGGGSERIADGQVEAQAVLEAGDVVITLFVRIRIGRVQADAEVGADDQNADVITQSEARAQGDLVQEALPFQLRAGAFGVVLQQPDVAGVEE